MSLTYVLVAQHPWWRTCCSVNVSSGCLLLLLLLLLQWQSQRIFLSKRVIELKVKCRIERREGSLVSGREGSNRDSQNSMVWVRLKSTTDSLLNWWGERLYLIGEWRKIKTMFIFFRNPNCDNESFRPFVCVMYFLCREQISYLGLPVLSISIT